MINLAEISALIEIADRAPKSGAETLWLRDLVARMNESVTQQQQSSVSLGDDKDN
jgi:hypothetical protein